LTGYSNTAIGAYALYVSNGLYNTATGKNALRYLTTGSHNTANGVEALRSNITGSNNTAIGYQADVTSGNLANATAIGYNAKVDASNKIQLGDANVTSVATSGALTTGTVTYPNTAGTPGQVLTINANNTATWGTPTGGATGPQGATGAAGTNGTTGAVGATGAQGIAGPTGAAGPQGADGTNGTNGTNGTDGATGLDGQGGVTTAGTNVTITGTGTVGDPYVVNATGGGSPTYTIGLWPELGGYVFWVSADGKHGLVAETQDQGTATWYEAQNLISNPSNHSLNGQKFRDWRMPTKHELNEIYLQQVVVGGFATNFYWSSTEYASSNAWVQFFTNGYQTNSDKNLYLYYVRSVRAF
jgi:hypothetical protein